MAAITPRDASRIVQDAGLQLVSQDRAGSNHIRIRVQRPDGHVATFILPSSPSDCRALKNESARLRRFARGDFNPIMERSK